MDIFLTLFLTLLPVFFLLLTRRSSAQSLLPPGSLGLPIIGQSLTLLQKMRANTADEWMEGRAKKYGPISKLSLFGKPTVFIYGQAANKFIFGSSSKILGNQQTESVRMVLGDRNLLELSGEDHKRVRGALVSFLKPECLKQYVGKIDGEVRKHIEMHWNGKQEVTVLPLMKTLTFNIICNILFGIEHGARRDEYVKCFKQIIEGVWSIPINLPFTRYNRSLQASARVKNMVKDLIREKRIELEQNGASPDQDLITCMLSIRDGNKKELLSEDEIADNVLLVMVAGHDTSSVLITFMIRLLASDPTVYKAILEEQEEIRKGKPSGEFLTFEDIAKMKYTWRVALETLRMFPPVFAGFRKTLEDVEFGSYTIPKGWQVFWLSSKTQMDASIFPEPSKFNPSRFENQTASVPRYSFVAFGAGYRICPGYEFAKMETLVAIHHLITKFTWKLCCTDNFFARDPMPVPTKGLPIRVTPKNAV